MLRDTFVLHCIVAIDMDTCEVFRFVQEQCYTDFPKWFEEEVACVVGHNIINFDLLALKAACGMDYTVGPDTVQQLLSKLLIRLSCLRRLTQTVVGTALNTSGNCLVNLRSTESKGC